MKMTMTYNQIQLARHALGLRNKENGVFSYRNHFCAGVGHIDYIEWRRMVDRGFAVRFHRSGLPFGSDDLFKLTRAGAEAALYPGERLDPEDFALRYPTKQLLGRF
jgi:hypothetical protein